MEYENISLGEAIDILEEVMELDDSIYAYNRKYRMALEFVIDCIKRDIDVKVEIEQKAYLDGFEGCAKSVEKYLSNEDKKKLECLVSALRNSVAIDWGEESEVDFPQTKDIEPTVKGFVDTMNRWGDLVEEGGE